MLIAVLTMTLFLLCYAVTRLFFKHTKESGLNLRRAWIKYIAFPLYNIKLELEGAPIDEAALYVCNHRSFMDPVITSKYLDAFIIAKAEIGNYPIINKGAEATGVIWVKREDKGSREGARKAFIDVIKGGHNILVYPEGTVSLTKQTLPFKKGTFYSAIEEDLPVVPVVLEYRDDKDLWRIFNIVGQYMNQFGSWRTVVKMKFGPKMTADDGESLARKCEEWVNTTMMNMHKDWSRMNFEEK